MKRKPVLVWDAWNKEHIKKHAVTVAEVEEGYQKSELVAKGKKKRTQILSKLKNGRLVIIFLSFAKQPEPYVVSARDASNTERRTYYEKKSKN